MDVAGMSDVDVGADRFGDVVPLDPIPCRRTQECMTLDERAASTAAALDRVCRISRYVKVVPGLVGLSAPPVLQSLDCHASSDDQVRGSAVVAVAPEDSVSGVAYQYSSLPSTVPLRRWKTTHRSRWLVVTQRYPMRCTPFSSSERRQT